MSGAVCTSRLLIIVSMPRSSERVVDDDQDSKTEAIRHLDDARELCAREGRTYAAFLISMALIELTNETSGSGEDRKGWNDHSA